MEDVGQGDLDDNLMQEEALPGVDEKLDVIELSLFFGWLTEPHSMKIRGHVKSKVIVLIDCVASHNFISSPLVSELDLTLTPTREFGVVFGTGEQTRTTWICCQLFLHWVQLHRNPSLCNTQISL